MKSILILFVFIICLSFQAQAATQLKCSATFNGDLLTVDTTYHFDQDGYVALDSNLIVRVNTEKIFSIPTKNVRVYNDDEEVIAFHYLDLKSQEYFYLRFGHRGPRSLIVKRDGARVADMESRDLVCNF